MSCFLHLRSCISRITYCSIVVIYLSGCTSKFLYNSAQDKQGQTAAKAASELKPADTVAAIEKRFDGLLALELDAADKRYSLIRENEIRKMVFVDKPINETFIKQINDRLVEIGGNVDWVQLKQFELNNTTNKNIANEAIDTFNDTFSVSTACSDIKNQDELPETISKKIPEDIKSEVINQIRHLYKVCTDFIKSQQKLDDATQPIAGTKLFSAIKQLESDNEEQRQNEHKKKETEQELKKAMEAYSNEAGRLGKENDTAYKTRTADAAKKLQDALKNLEKGEHAVGIEVLAKERLERINDLISAVAGGNVDTSNWDAHLRKSTAIAGSLPALADEMDTLLREAKRPRLTPLVIAREHQQKLVEESERVEEILTRRVIASENIVAAYRNEINVLENINEKLTGKQSWHTRSLLQLNKELQSEERRQLYELLGKYFDDVPRFQREQQLWEYRRVATFYDESIVRSKYAAMMWQNLLEGTANTLSAYHGSGIKPEDLARLIQAVGVLSIGAGVNR